MKNNCTTSVDNNLPNDYESSTFEYHNPACAVTASDLEAIINQLHADTEGAE